MDRSAALDVRAGFAGTIGDAAGHVNLETKTMWPSTVYVQPRTGGFT
jgi:hypothetical protein